MSTLADNDLAASGATSRIKQHVKQMVAVQGVCADAAAGALLMLNHGAKMISQAGTIVDAYVIIGAVAAANESLVVDIQKSTDNGATWATVLTAPKTINDVGEPAQTVIPLAALLDADKVGVDVGDILCVVLDYTAGGGPTPILNTMVVAEIGSVVAE